MIRKFCAWGSACGNVVGVVGGGASADSSPLAVVSATGAAVVLLGSMIAGRQVAVLHHALTRVQGPGGGEAGERTQSAPAIVSRCGQVRLAVGRLLSVASVDIAG